MGCGIFVIGIPLMSYLLLIDSSIGRYVCVVGILWNLCHEFRLIAPWWNLVRSTRTGSVVATTGRRGRRPQRNVETPTPDNHESTNHNAQNLNVDAQDDNGHFSPNTPTVDQDMINQLVNQCVAKLLAESNHSNTSAGIPLPTRITGCNYKEFRTCGPIEFCGTEGVVYLVRWIEKTESVFTISGCAENAKVKFSTFTLKD